MKVFCDMDGVLADFVGGAAKRHGRSLPYNTPEAKGVWEIEKLWGQTEAEFWEPIRDAEFWATLSKTPEADRIIEELESKFGSNNVAILTAEGPGFSIQGKKIWLMEHYPQFEKRIIFTHAKEFLAGPNSLLVDDRDKNVEVFREAGGRAILIPRDWNKDWPLAGSALKIFNARLGRI